MLLWITHSIYAIFSLIIQKYFIEIFFYLDVTDFNQGPPTPLIYHHGESRKMCTTTYPQSVMQSLNRPQGVRKVCFGENLACFVFL